MRHLTPAAEDVAAAGQHGLRGALGVHREHAIVLDVDGGHALAVRVEMEHRAPGGVASRALTSAPSWRASVEQGQLGWVSHGCWPAVRSSALVQLAALRASHGSAGSRASALSARCPARRRAASRHLVAPSPGIQIRVTLIRFWVSVPVLSVQITVVEPRVSTADRRLTTAPRRARSRTPTASASVMVGSSPSGTFATINPIAKLSAAASVRPARQGRRQNAMPATDRDQRDQPGDRG